MKRIFIGIVSILLLLTILTGCSTITETFGKEYRMVDDFCDQLEADIRFSVNEYTSTLKDYSERKNEIDNNLDLLVANLKIRRNEMKLKIKDAKKYADEVGYTGSVSDYLEKGLLEARIKIEQEFKEATDDKFILKHAEVNRGFFGSIWHFVRNHWLITLIILCAVSALGEKLGELWQRIRKSEY